MRIVVVEDEAKTSEGLIRIIGQTVHEVVGHVADGLAGMEAVKKHLPDLIISDIKMPRLDGLQMLQKITDEGVEFQAILITGYSEFDYARQALKLGVSEYLLKPIDLDELLSALEKTENRLNKRELSRASVGQLIYTLMTSPQEDKLRLRLILGERLKMGSRDRATLFLIRPGSLDNETATEIRYQIEQMLGKLYMDDYYLSHLPGLMGILVILMGTENQIMIKDIFKNKILSSVRAVNRCSCSTAPLASAGELEQRIDELDELLEFTFSFDAGEIIDSELVAALDFQKTEYPEDIEKLIRKAIRCAEHERVMELGEQFRARVIESGGNPGHIREYTARFASAVLYAIDEWNSYIQREEHFGSQQILQKIIGGQSRQDLSEQLDRVLDIACGDSLEWGQTENAIILKVISFICNNYGRDITLTDAAELAGITPEYLSKLFFQEIGINFVVFLRNFRISIAKRLLAGGKHKIHEVAKLVGFHDAKYFNKVFKTVCGISPSEYKKDTIV